MHVGAESRVVRQVVAIVVRVRVEDDVVAVPQPVGHEHGIESRNLEEEAPDVEPLPPATEQSPYVLGTDRSVESPVFPWVSEMVASVVAPHVMTNPLVVRRVDVRSLRMPRLVPLRLWLPARLRSLRLRLGR